MEDIIAEGSVARMTEFEMNSSGEQIDAREHGSILSIVVVATVIIIIIAISFAQVNIIF